MSNQTSLSAGRLRKPLLIALVCTVALLMSGCVTVIKSGSATYVTFWERTTDTIAGWHDRDCRGNPRCTFFYIRANLCNNLPGTAGAQFLCYAGTDPKVRGAGGLSMDALFIYQLAIREQQNGDCLAIHNNSGVGWDVLDRGQLGCRH